MVNQFDLKSIIHKFKADITSTINHERFRVDNIIKLGNIIPSNNSYIVKKDTISTIDMTRVINTRLLNN